jgi:hypothetical protein
MATGIATDLCYGGRYFYLSSFSLHLTFPCHRNLRTISLLLRAWLGVFLAIPGTSVSVERLFSKSRHLCHEAPVSMKAKTIMMK